MVEIMFAVTIIAMGLSFYAGERHGRKQQAAGR